MHTEAAKEEIRIVFYFFSPPIKAYIRRRKQNLRMITEFPPSSQILFSTFKSLCAIWMSTLSLANSGNSVFVFIFAFIWHSHALYLKAVTEQWITDLGSGDITTARLEMLWVLINPGCRNSETGEPGLTDLALPCSLKESSENLQELLWECLTASHWGDGAAQPSQKTAGVEGAQPKYCGLQVISSLVWTHKQTRSEIFRNPEDQFS